MALLLATLAALFGLPLLGALLGWIQVGWYRLRKTPPDDIPFFPFLVFRGMLVLLALIAAGTVTAHVLSQQ
jgi:hypothetical protein